MQNSNLTLPGKNLYMAVEIDLQGKIAIVTGGTRGIGRETVIALGAAGAHVVINARESSTPQAEELIDLLKPFGVEGIWVPGDIAEPETGQNLVKKTVDKFGSVDILVNNAGINRDGLHLRMSDKQWDEVLQVNLYGSMRVTRAALKPMMGQEEGGSIIFVSSVAAHGMPGQSNYAAAKGAIESYMKSIAVEYASRGIRANAVAPGPVDTDMVRSLKKEQIEALVRMVPLGRLLEAREVANTILFLASSLASGTTGQVYNVDGGMVR